MEVGSSGKLRFCDLDTTTLRRAPSRKARASSDAGRFAGALRAQARCFSAMPMLIQLTPAQIKSTLRKMPST
ncbi:MAG: hypothetical protein ACI9HH_003403 [Pseudomonadota bacterium]|jgi:hypothetical protein